MTEWIKCSDRMPPPDKPRIVYGAHMSSHWPDIAYAKWVPLKQGGCWIDCFSYGSDEMIREHEVTHWLDVDLPVGLHE